MYKNNTIFIPWVDKCCVHNNTGKRNLWREWIEIGGAIVVTIIFFAKFITVFRLVKLSEKVSLRSFGEENISCLSSSPSWFTSVGLTSLSLLSQAKYSFTKYSSSYVHRIVYSSKFSSRTSNVSLELSEDKLSSTRCRLDERCISYLFVSSILKRQVLQ